MISVMHTPLFKVSKTQPGSVDLFSTVVNSSYAAHTKYAFALVETVAIAKLQCQGLTYEAIRQQVVVDDLLQIRSQASRQGAIRTIWQRLEKLPIEYIQLIAMGHLDVRRFTVLLAILLQNRLLRELIDDVLRDKVKQFERVVKPADLRGFFEGKRAESQTLANWSEATYQKSSSNTVSVLVSAGLLQPMKPKGTYEIRVTPVPIALKQQLIADGLEQFLLLMLD
jgi:hypothetical protein